MFGFSFGELILLSLVGLIVLGPSDLPRMMYGLGKIFRRLSYIRYAFTQQFDDFMRQAEKDARNNKTEKPVQTVADEQGEDEDDLGFDYSRLPNEKKSNSVEP